MSKLKITPGEWLKDDLGVYCNSGITRGNIVCQSPDREFIDSKTYWEANATIIADAGTTYNQCGLSPSELLAARDKSEEDYDKLSNTAVQLKYENNELLQQNEELKEAAVGLNSVIDKMWNDHSTLSYDKKIERYSKAICSAQQNLHKILTKYTKP